MSDVKARNVEIIFGLVEMLWIKYDEIFVCCCFNLWFVTLVTIHENLCKFGIGSTVKGHFIVSCNSFKLKSRLKCYRNLSKK